MLITKKLLEIDKYLENLVANEDIPCINYGIVTLDGNWVTSKGFKQVLPSHQPNSLDTLFDLGSLTAVICTTPCILKLMEEKKLKWDTPISKFVTKFKDKTVTVGQCLTHTSGLPYDIDEYHEMDKDHFLKALYDLKTDPKKVGKVKYSHCNSILLGMVVDKLGGSLAEYAKKVLFDPLGMHRTMFNPEPGLKYNCAATENRSDRNGIVLGEVHDYKAYILGGACGHAGLFTTIGDLMSFVSMILHNGQFKGNAILDEESIELYTKPQTKGKHLRSAGWMVDETSFDLGSKHSDEYLYSVSFTGPSILVDIDKKMAIILLTNRIHPNRNNDKIEAEKAALFDRAYTCVGKTPRQRRRI